MGFNKQFPYYPLSVGDEEGNFIANNNPFATYDVDPNGRTSPNSVFGEKITGIRKSQISAQFQYNIASDDAVTVINSTGDITIEESLLKISTGTASDGLACIYSSETVHYVPGQEVYCFFTAIFSSPQINSYQRVGLFDDSNGFYVGYHDDEFCFTRLRNGVEDHNVINLGEFKDKYGYDFNPLMGNIYKISYGYLGFAPISLEVLTPDGSIVTLAKIRYPNNYTVTHTTQTFLPVRGEVANTGNTTNLIVASGSLSAGIVNGGNSEPANRQFTFRNLTAYTVAGASTRLVAFRIKDTFNGIPNKVPGTLLFISGANDVNKTIRWAILLNPTVTAAGTWVDVDTANSVIEYSEDITIDTATGKTLLAWNTAKVDSFREDVSNYEIDMRPGGIAVFVVFSDPAATGASDLSIRWKERF